ncbi:MAG TPA: hypothetical protein VMZ71_15365, partial [Gemmataceae bacterium]|nr:hypothetical protein [Gemmataceae bacterium]
LWRLTWRVNRPWLDDVARSPGAIDDKPELLALLTRVTIEHLGRHPDLAPVARAYLVRLAAKCPDVAAAEVPRLAALGGRGWGVLLLVLQESPPSDNAKVSDALRAAVLREAIGRPTALALVHHHAHRFVLDRWEGPVGRDDELVTAAADVLAAIGPPAGTALPDLLRLLGRHATIGAALAVAAKAVAPGHPLAVSAVIRSLGLVRVQGPEARAAFGHLAGVLFHLDPDAGPGLVSQTTVPDHAVAQVLDSGHWQGVAPADRAKHAAYLADLLASPRADVRRRAAAALKHYLPELPGVWPAAVAALAAADEMPAEVLLTYTRLLAPVADAVAAELLALFADPNPDYAARAGVALWRLGLWDEIAPRLRDSEPIARGMVRRARFAHGLLEDIAALFDGEPLAAEARTFLQQPLSLLDALLSGLHPPESPSDAKWKAIQAAADQEPKPVPPLIVLAVMSGFGTGEFPLKIWMIKHHREMTRASLGDSKRAVERVMEQLTGEPTPQARAACRRRLFWY